MRGAKVGKAELARRLNYHLPQVDRLLDLTHASRLDQIEAAFRALGKQLLIEIREVEPSYAAVLLGSKQGSHARA
jgi:antitoxin HicB